MQTVHHRPYHHHPQGPHHHPVHVEGTNPAVGLGAVGLGLALGFGPVGVIIAAGAGSVAGAAWLIRRSRSKSDDIYDR
jgi:hypothetical protein